ncbi:MAG TPA: adenosylcobinamide-GDP ribazoletransferase [Acidimicrobiia bacterium]
MREAFAFLTVVGRPATPTPRALRWFPVVGAAIGAAVGGVWLLAGQAFPALLAATLAVGADLAVTGLLHADGLADAADGLLPHADRARRLEIMRTAGVGAFGVAVLAVVLLTRVSALAARPADVGLVVGLWCASRTVVAAAPVWMPYAREAGLASSLLETPASPLVAVALAPAAALATLAIGWVGGAAVGAAVVGAGLVLVLAWRRVGGFTGDVLGAAILVGETRGLVVAAARW